MTKFVSNKVNKTLLVGDNFRPEIHLKQPRFTYSACEPFTKHKQKTQKLKEIQNLRHFYQK